MTAVEDESYEALLDTIVAMPASASDQVRDVVWCDGNDVVGVGRSALGEAELFVAGEPLLATRARVRDALVHQAWRTESGAPVLASRLQLPAGAHYDHVAAFLLTELLRNGASTDPQGGFARTESLIDLVMQQAAVQSTFLVGLVGELLLLNQLSLTLGPAGTSSVVQSWAGNDRSARDLQLGNVGVEVKTTTGLTSRHHVQGVHQVEPGAAVGGALESDLFLLSIGITWSRDHRPGDRTLPGLVQAIVDRLDANGDPVRPFLDKVYDYGSGARGYDHPRMALEPRYAQPFGITFARLYDLLDPGVQVLRSPLLQPVGHVDPASVSFDVDLPDVITRPDNPVVGLPDAADLLLLRGGLLA